MVVRPSNHGPIVINGRGHQSSLPNAPVDTDIVKVGNILFLPKPSPGTTRFNPALKEKFNHMVLILSINQPKVQVLMITSKYPPNDRNKLRYYVRLKWDPYEIIHESSFIEVKVVVGKPFKTASYLKMKVFEVEKRLLTSLRGGQARAMIEKHEMVKVLSQIPGLAGLSGPELVNITGANSNLHTGAAIYQQANSQHPFPLSSQSANLQPITYAEVADGSSQRRRVTTTTSSSRATVPSSSLGSNPRQNHTDTTSWIRMVIFGISLFIILSPILVPLLLLLVFLLITIMCIVFLCGCLLALSRA